jgi:hypothetical protein
MAMEWPGTRVIIVPLQHDERRRVGVLSILKNLYITSLRVIRVDNCTIPVTETLSKHVEIVTVKMHWVGAELTVVPDNNTNAAVRANVDDVPIRIELASVGRKYKTRKTNHSFSNVKLPAFVSKSTGSL